MKYEMLKTTGALQDGLESSIAKRPARAQEVAGKRRSQLASMITLPASVEESASDGESEVLLFEEDNNDAFLADVDDVQTADHRARPMPGGANPVAGNTRQTEVIYLAGKGNLTPQMEQTMMRGNNGMLFYTIPEGQRVLVTDKHGRSEIVQGPRRICKWGKRFQTLQHFIAYPGEFLIVKSRDGSQHHFPGPKEAWLDPRVHAQIERSEALQIAGKEAVVVYAKDASNQITSRLVTGPALFVPSPGEWLHTFSWHGSTKESYRKIPGGLVFQKLWLMPDQMYHDVEEVRTSDDVAITIKLMIFFELRDVEKMLAGTHDPIGDFINATSSDVIELVSRYTFDEFKTQSHKLTELASYPQLLNRAEQVGYQLHKIVYRGYITAAALQKMHEQSIETRTRLKLERETEEQSQKLADFKLECELQRLSHKRNQDKAQEIHELEKQKLHHQQELELYRERSGAEQHEHQQSQEQQVQYLQQLKQMGVELTSYLTQQRADQVIELRGQTPAPHIHLQADKAKPKA